MTADRSARTTAPPVTWDWGGAGLGVAYAIPAAIAILSDVSAGLALAVGVLPAAVIGLAPTRRGRVATVVVGVMAGVPMFVGATLAQVPWLAVLAILLLGAGTAVVASRARIGAVALSLSMPMVGVGLSYASGEGLQLALLMIGGSIYAFLVSLLWPERPAPPTAERPTMTPPTLGYGLRLGAAGATAAAIGFALGLDHVGWAAAAAMLVMRPSHEMQRLRSVGRVASVAIGALAGILLIRSTTEGLWFSLAVMADLGAGAAMHRSRWYITPAFTTFLVFLLLLSSDPQAASSRFGERLTETVLGVALAFLFGLAVPATIEKIKGQRRDI